MTKNNLLTNDELQYDQSNKYQDSIDFFIGNEITIEKKENDSSDDSISEDEISGLEAIILGFTQSTTTSTCSYGLNSLTGNEGIGETAKSIWDAILNFIKDVGQWVYELFANKLSRIDSRIKYTEQKRRINGIKDKEIKYGSYFKQLYIPDMVSSNAAWVSNAVKRAEDFYKKVIIAHKKLKDYIKKQPKTSDELTSLKTEILTMLGKTITGKSPENGGYHTNILPGNRVFNILLTSIKNDQVLTYFTDSTVRVTYKVDTWLPTTAIIDEAINTLKRFKETILNEQKNTSSLLNAFKDEINLHSKANKNISKETKHYYIWLTNLNKRLTNSTLQYSTHCIEALDDFINAGLK